MPLGGRIGENGRMIKKVGKDKPNGGGTIALNKRARHEYHFEEKYEAGLALQGWELKSIRAGQADPRQARGQQGTRLEPREAAAAAATQQGRVTFPA